MFVLDCAGCGDRRLLGTHRVRAIRNLSPGLIAVEVFCLCGAPVTIITGGRSRPGPDRHRDRDPPALPPDPDAAPPPSPSAQSLVNALA